MKVKGAIWRFNLEHNGLEIKFDGKPDEDIRRRLKDARFRWARLSKVWYCKGFQTQLELAKEIAEQGENEGEALTFAEKMARKEERAEVRTERYSDKAEAASKRSDELIHQASQLPPRERGGLN